MTNTKDVRWKIQKIKDRSLRNEHIIKNVSSIFSDVSNLDSEMCKSMIDSMTFSSYPGVKKDSSIALTTLLSNKSNNETLSSSGSMG